MKRRRSNPWAYGYYVNFQGLKACVWRGRYRQAADGMTYDMHSVDEPARYGLPTWSQSFPLQPSPEMALRHTLEELCVQAGSSDYMSFRAATLREELKRFNLPDVPANDQEFEVTE